MDVRISITFRGIDIFSLRHRVHTDSGSHPASYPMDTVGSYAGIKAAGLWSCLLTST